MKLIIEDGDLEFEKYLKEKIESLNESCNCYILGLYDYIQEHDFTAKFIKTDITDYRGEAYSDNIVIHKTKFETYNSLCWIFFHELGHLMLIGSPFESIMRCARAEDYAKKGFRNAHGCYWSEEGYYDYYKKHHDEDLEENIVSLCATWIVGENYDRKWWNKQKEIIK